MDEEPKQDEIGKNETQENESEPHEDPKVTEPTNGADEGEGDEGGSEFETIDLDAEAGEIEEEDGSEEEEMPDMSNLLPPTDVPTLSHLFISMLTNSSWQHLGLIPDPKTQKITMDLKQAGLAIDIIEFLYEKLKDDMEKELASGVEDLLANLRINYVTKSAVTP